jgi:hypothetical protein
MNARNRLSRRTWRLSTAGLALAAGAFALPATAQAQGGEKERKAERSGQNIELRGHEIYLRVKEYKSADANGDGKLSRAERPGFLVALAMQSGSAVIREFPAADSDENGKLSTSEAVELVQGTRARADLERRFALESYDSEENAKAARRKANIELWTRVMDAREWLLDNMTGEPTAEKVAEYAEIIAASDRAEFLKKNPAADADGDGILTAEEQNAYQSSRWSRKLAEIREQIAEIEAALARDDLSPGRIKKLQDKLERLRGGEAEYLGAIESRSKKP